MNYKTIFNNYSAHYKEDKLSGRYITIKDIEPLLDKLTDSFSVKKIGTSVNNAPIHKVIIGTGPIKVLGWSQMHGNESTTTKALFDFFSWLLEDKNNAEPLLSNFTLCFIPMLNPDGAAAYTRHNAQSVDLNRDAQDLSQPESRVLRELFDSFKPHYCLNLHGQRTIFGVHTPPKSAIISFLSPSQDALRTVTLSRKKGMQVIGEVATLLESFIPNQIGRYDDSFNINCVGDTFQHHNVPTILFEAGHYPGDYMREETRKLIFISYIKTLEAISTQEEKELDSSTYFKIPENKKVFYDYVVRNVYYNSEKNIDIAVQYEEIFKNNQVDFIPKIADYGDLNEFQGHQECDFKGSKIENIDIENLKKGSVIDNFSTNKDFTITFSLKNE